MKTVPQIRIVGSNGFKYLFVICTLQLVFDYK